jgi:hypothetical protein
MLSYMNNSTLNFLIRIFNLTLRTNLFLFVNFFWNNLKIDSRLMYNSIHILSLGYKITRYLGGYNFCKPLTSFVDICLTNIVFALFFISRLQYIFLLNISLIKCFFLLLVLVVFIIKDFVILQKFLIFFYVFCIWFFVIFF